MKKPKKYIHLLLCISILCLLTACTPAAYDSGKVTETKEVDTSSIIAVDVAQYQTISNEMKYMRDADISAKKKDGTPYKLSWCCNDMTDEQMAYLTTCMKKFAKEIGIDLICFDGQADPQKQIDQINQSIIQKCDGVIIAPIDSSAENIAMMKAKKEGLTVINAQMPITDDAYYDIYVGPSDTMAGQQAASMLVDQLPEGGKVVVIEGLMGSAAQINRDLGFESVLEKYDKYEIIEKQTANWTTVEAMNVMESYLAKYKDLSAVYCHNDAEALGALKAIENAKRDDILVFSTDGMQSVIDLVADQSCIYGTSMQPIELNAKVQTLAALACLNGDKDKIDKMIYTDNVCVTRENASTVKSGWGGE